MNTLPELILPRLPALMVLEYLKDLPAGVGFTQTSSISTPQAAQAWAAQFMAERVYFYTHRAGYKSAFIVLESKSKGKTSGP
jgi:hypothetical protein